MFTLRPKSNSRIRAGQDSSNADDNDLPSVGDQRGHRVLRPRPMRRFLSGGSWARTKRALNRNSYRLDFSVLGQRLKP
jgi:hypothetical protein